MRPATLLLRQKSGGAKGSVNLLCLRAGLRMRGRLIR
jgi:hypothetical protein